MTVDDIDVPLETKSADGSNVFLGLTLEFYKAHPWLLVASISFMALMPISSVLLPHLFGRLVDVVEHRKPPWRVLAAVAGVMAVVQCGSFLRDWLDTRTTPLFETFLRVRMLRDVVTRLDGQIVEPSTGELVSRFVRVPGLISLWVTRVNDYLLPFAGVLVAAFVYFLLNDGVLAALLAGLVASLALLAALGPRRCRAATLATERGFNRMHDNVEEVLRNLQSVFAGNRVGAELARLEASSADYQRAYTRTMRCALALKAVAAPLVVCFFGAFVVRCIRLIAQGRMTTGRFVSLFMVLNVMLDSMLWIVSVMRDLVFDSGTLADMEQQMRAEAAQPSQREDDERERVQERDEAQKQRPPPPQGVGLRDVTYTHAAGRAPTLRRLSLHFEPGERSVLLGAIGSGKSTVLRLLMRFYTPASGDLYLGGRWYSEMGRREVRRRVAYVPQEAVLFDRSVLDNVVYGNARVTREDAEAALRALGVDRHFGNLERGMHGPVGKGGSKLSGGQRQLVWFMRAVLRDPEVLLLDEPTASMDEATKRLVIHVLDTVLAGRTVIMVTHDPVMVRAATREVQVR